MNRRRHLQRQAADLHLGESLTYIVSPLRPISGPGVAALLIGLVLTVALAQVAPFLLTLLSLWMVVLVLLVALMWIGTGLWLLAPSVVHARGIHCLVCTNGLTLSYRRRAETIRWEEIQTLWRKKTENSVTYEIRLENGHSILLDARIPGISRLVTLLERELTGQRFGRLLQEYRKGVELTFGSLGISQSGLQVQPRQETIPWSQIKYIRNIQDELVIGCKGDTEHWASIPLSALPNACLLHALIRCLFQVHRATAARERCLLPRRPQPRKVELLAATGTS